MKRAPLPGCEMLSVLSLGILVTWLHSAPAGGFASSLPLLPQVQQLVTQLQVARSDCALNCLSIPEPGQVRWRERDENEGWAMRRPEERAAGGRGRGLSGHAASLGSVPSTAELC